jgi:hypothetical protein
MSNAREELRRQLDERTRYFGSKNYFYTMRSYLPMALCLMMSCTSHRQIGFAERQKMALSGTQFYKQASAYDWRQRDSLAVKEIVEGNVPSFLKKFTAIKTSVTNTRGKTIKATYYVSADYLSVGSDNDWARIPMTPMAAQRVADSLGCFLPTRKIVNDIYQQARIKLEPVPLFAFRDSTLTMYHHHLIVEGQRQQRNGLIAGIKKDVVISGKISRDTRPNRVAIYGWHKTDGKPIQPLYTGHVNWYVDYSHGIRLVYRRIKVDGKWMDYADVLKDPVLQKLICDEEFCDYYRY